MNMLAGLLQPTSGTIKVNGQVVSIDSPSKATKIGYWDGPPALYVG